MMNHIIYRIISVIHIEAESVKKVFKKSVVMVFVVMLFAALFACPVFGASVQVTATIPSFLIKLNELKYDNNDYERYPLLVYRDITYFPMTFYQSNLLNLNTSWTDEDGLVITKGNPTTPKEFKYEEPVATRNSRTQTAMIIDSKVTVNGKVIDNRNEPYPLLNFRGITYFPLTWRFAVEEFGWQYSYDDTIGLIIGADNYFYTANGDSYADAERALSVDNETHYLNGDLWIYIKTEARNAGPYQENLHIIKGGVEIKPEGYFGYFQKNGPLFTVDGDHITTTYIPLYGGKWEDHQLRKVRIETGQMLQN